MTITVKLLIENRADIYARNNEGKTPIHECFTESPFYNFYSSVSALVRGKMEVLCNDKIARFVKYKNNLSCLEF